MEISDLLFKLHQMRDQQSANLEEEEEREFRLRLKMRKENIKDNISQDNPLMGEFEMKPSLEKILEENKENEGGGGFFNFFSK